MKLWARVMLDEKIVKQHTILVDRLFMQNLQQHLTDLCYELDVSTPLLLQKHITSLEKFNHIKFIPKDFVEPFEFDKMILEVF